MKLYVAESKLEISCNIIDDFRRQYELALDKIYDLQGEIDELVDECCQQKQTILTLNSKLSQIQKKYKTQSEQFIKYCSDITITNLESIRNGRDIIKKLLVNKKQK
jgi:molecular chaperone GrpE (heat shock protein)